jgi:hypothetical protein
VSSSDQLSPDARKDYTLFYKPPLNSDDDDVGFLTRYLPATSSPSLDFPGDPHAVSMEEAESYYDGLASEPTLLYRTGGQWEARRRKKQLIPVFGGQLERPWNEGNLGRDVVEAMEDHAVS